MRILSLILIFQAALFAFSWGELVFETPENIYAGQEVLVKIGIPVAYKNYDLSLTNDKGEQSMLTLVNKYAFGDNFSFTLSASKRGEFERYGETSQPAYPYVYFAEPGLFNSIAVSKDGTVSHTFPLPKPVRVQASTIDFSVDGSFNAVIDRVQSYGFNVPDVFTGSSHTIELFFPVSVQDYSQGKVTDSKLKTIGAVRIAGGRFVVVLDPGHTLFYINLKLPIFSDPFMITVNIPSANFIINTPIINVGNYRLSEDIDYNFPPSMEISSIAVAMIAANTDTELVEPVSSSLTSNVNPTDLPIVPPRPQNNDSLSQNLGNLGNGLKYVTTTSSNEAGKIVFTFEFDDVPLNPYVITVKNIGTYTSILDKLQRCYIATRDAEAKPITLDVVGVTTSPITMKKGSNDIICFFAKSTDNLSALYASVTINEEGKNDGTTLSFYTGTLPPKNYIGFSHTMTVEPSLTSTSLFLRTYASKIQKGVVSDCKVVKNKVDNEISTITISCSSGLPHTTPLILYGEEAMKELNTLFEAKSINWETHNGNSYCLTNCGFGCENKCHEYERCETSMDCDGALICVNKVCKDAKKKDDTDDGGKGLNTNAIIATVLIVIIVIGLIIGGRYFMKRFSRRNEQYNLDSADDSAFSNPYHNLNHNNHGINAHNQYQPPSYPHNSNNPNNSPYNY